MAEAKRKIITITLTQACNLRCTYCYEKNKSHREMDVDLVKRILDESLNDDRFDEYEIDFFGGEPFLRFDLIREGVYYARNTYPEKPMVFMATTNGTLVHGEIKEWLSSHAEIFVCGLSLDGTKRMHDMNRSNSFDLIDVDFFARTWPKQAMKMTVSAESLPYLAEGIRYMHEKGYLFTCNLAHDIDWSFADNKARLERELMSLIDYYTEHPEINPCQLLNVPIHMVATMAPDSSFRQCGAGEEMFSYDVDGHAYPCQFFMPVTLGEERAEEAKKLVFREELFREDFPEPCRSCVALGICQNCYGANYENTGDILKRDENWCELQKIIFKATAYFRWKLYKEGRLNCPEDEVPYNLKAIEMLLTQLT